MAGETYVTVVGNLAADPELRFTPAGVGVANFRVMSTPRTFDKQRNEWVDGEPLVVACAAWRDMAENVAETLTKGMRVIVHGALSQRVYDRQDGTRGTSLDLNVSDVGPSLWRATAKVTRTSGQSRGQAAQAKADTWGANPADPPF